MARLPIQRARGGVRPSVGQPRPPVLDQTARAIGQLGQAAQQIGTAIHRVTERNKAEVNAHALAKYMTYMEPVEEKINANPITAEEGSQAVEQAHSDAVARLQEEHPGLDDDFIEQLNIKKEVYLKGAAGKSAVDEQEMFLARMNGAVDEMKRGFGGLLPEEALLNQTLDTVERAVRESDKLEGFDTAKEEFIASLKERAEFNFIDWRAMVDPFTAEEELPAMNHLSPRSLQEAEGIIDNRKKAVREIEGERIKEAVNALMLGELPGGMPSEERIRKVFGDRADEMLSIIAQGQFTFEEVRRFEKDPETGEPMSDIEIRRRVNEIQQSEATDDVKNSIETAARNVIRNRVERPDKTMETTYGSAATQAYSVVSQGLNAMMQDGGMIIDPESDMASRMVDSFNSLAGASKDIENRGVTLGGNAVIRPADAEQIRNWIMNPEVRSNAKMMFFRVVNQTDGNAKARIFEDLFGKGFRKHLWLGDSSDPAFQNRAIVAFDNSDSNRQSIKDRGLQAQLATAVDHAEAKAAEYMSTVPPMEVSQASRDQIHTSLRETLIDYATQSFLDGAGDDMAEHVDTAFDRITENFAMVGNVRVPRDFSERATEGVRNVQAMVGTMGDIPQLGLLDATSQFNLNEIEDFIVKPYTAPDGEGVMLMYRGVDGNWRPASFQGEEIVFNESDLSRMGTSTFVSPGSFGPLAGMEEDKRRRSNREALEESLMLAIGRIREKMAADRPDEDATEPPLNGAR